MLVFAWNNLGSNPPNQQYKKTVIESDFFSPDSPLVFATFVVVVFFHSCNSGYAIVYWLPESLIRVRISTV